MRIRNFSVFLRSQKDVFVKEVYPGMSIFRHIAVALLLLLCIPCGANASTEGTEEPINVQKIIFDHMSDAYEWHLWGHTHISLPVIVKHHEGGWEVFSSARFHESADGTYNGFYIDHERKDKIYERGYEDRPWDLSITKDVLQIWINIAVILLIFIPCARWYARRRDEGDHSAPKGFRGAVEMLTMYIHDDVIKACIGEKHYRRYAPYLLTVFFFIFVTNLMGLIPIFPGGSNVTGNLSITLLLAVGTFLLVNIFGNKEYWKEILWPDVPMMMKCPVPLMPVVEIIGIFTKPFALMMRLFANMFGGHTVILSLTCLIFITFKVSIGMGSSMTVVSFLMLIFMNCLELLVAFLQAYVFTMLSSVYIGLAHPEHHHAK